MQYRWYLVYLLFQQKGAIVCQVTASGFYTNSLIISILTLSPLGLDLLLPTCPTDCLEGLPLSTSQVHNVLPQNSLLYLNMIVTLEEA